LTPVAELEPVNIGGVVVRRATLHNQSEIDRKDIRIGDTVVVRRQGDVIPAVISVVAAKRTGDERRFVLPTTCPECGSGVAKDDDEEVAVRCTNPHCPAKLVERLKHFVSRRGVDIDSLGEKLLLRLVESGRVQNAADLYTLSREELLQLERFGERSTERLLRGIEQSKGVGLAKFIYALGIRQVGEKTARDIAERVQSIEGFLALTEEELLQIPEVGPKVAQSVVRFLNDPSERGVVEGLVTNGVHPAPVEQRPSVEPLRDGPFAHQVVVLTGTLLAMSREEAKARVVELGGEVRDGITKAVTMLVVGESPGSKVKKAQALGIPIVDEEEFLRHLSRP
jgi:DNA ligase (NAD+)